MRANPLTPQLPAELPVFQRAVPMIFSRRIMLLVSLVALFSLSACDHEFFAIKKSDDPVVVDPSLSEEGETKPTPQGTIPEQADESSPPTLEDTTCAESKPTPS